MPTRKTQYFMAFSNAFPVQNAMQLYLTAIYFDSEKDKQQILKI